MRLRSPRSVAVAALLACGFSALTGFDVARAEDTPPAPEGPARLGINLGGIADWDTEQPFVDFIKMSRPWISQKQGEGWGKGPDLELDPQGYPTHLDPDCFVEVPMCTDLKAHFPLGNWTVLYDGKGEVNVKGVTVVSSEPGRIVFQPSYAQGEFFLRILSTDPADHIHNLHVLIPGAEKTYQTDPFNPSMIARWKGVGCVRFMDMMNTNGNAQVTWADRPKLDDFSYGMGKGVPVEVLCDLANRLDADAWFNMPAKADDDYIRNFAQVVKDRLNPRHKAYIEYSNEMWNSMFSQTHYTWDQGKALGIGPAERPWEGGGMYYAKRSVEIFKIWEDVFGGHDRLVRVLAWQAGSNWWTTNIVLPYQDAYKEADALAIAPYLTVLPRPGDAKLNSDDVAKWTVDQVLDYVQNTSLPESTKWITDQKAVADKFHLKLIAYEGGQHLVGVGGGENNPDLTALFQAANKSPRLGQIYDQYFAAWKAAGGGTFCYFSSTGRWSKWGSWGTMEYADDDPAQSPKYQALKRFAAGCGQALGE